MRNPDLFDICATYILGNAYQNFPIPTDINLFALYEEICEKFEDPSFDEAFNALNVIASSIEWLMASGYLSYQKADNNVAKDVLLTEKGLRALRSVPRSIDLERETVGDILAASGKDATKEMVLRGAGVFFGSVMSALTS